jgi:2-keto-3-deoxy-L-rhamnonate aldolase RhmA
MRATRRLDPLRAAGHAQLRAGAALLYGGADYPQLANETIVAFAMIETAAALDRPR